jgi:hypothetical protein
MFVLFKNVKKATDGLLLNVALMAHWVFSVTDVDGRVSIAYTMRDGYPIEVVDINLPIETVVGLINQALGQTAVPDQPEKSVVIIEGK